MKFYSETISEYIRNKIIKVANEISQLNCIDDIDSFFFSRSFFFSINFISMLNNFSSKKLTMLSKTKKLAKIVTAMKNETFFRKTAIAYRINRQIFKNKISKKRILVKYHESSQFLIFSKNAALLRFVDQFVALGFPSRLNMLKKKSCYFFIKKVMIELLILTDQRNFSVDISNMTSNFRAIWIKKNTEIQTFEFSKIDSNYTIKYAWNIILQWMINTIWMKKTI